MNNNNIYYYHYVFIEENYLDEYEDSKCWLQSYNKKAYKQVSTCLDYNEILARGSAFPYCEFIFNLLRAAIQHNFLSVYDTST